LPFPKIVSVSLACTQQAFQQKSETTEGEILNKEMLCEGYFAPFSLFFLTKGADLQEFPAVELK